MKNTILSIPNVSSLYQRIHKGAEGGHEFARFMRMLLMADYEAKGLHFISESDASGDYKSVDGYLPGDKDFPDLTTVFQYKFFLPTYLQGRKRLSQNLLNQPWQKTNSYKSSS
ncbi:MAG: hypothetical protein WBB45_07610 [Cyclobacteriaceae bacterium]